MGPSRRVVPSRRTTPTWSLLQWPRWRTGGEPRGRSISISRIREHRSRWGNKNSATYWVNGDIPMKAFWQGKWWIANFQMNPTGNTGNTRNIFQSHSTGRQLSGYKPHLELLGATVGMGNSLRYQKHPKTSKNIQKLQCFHTFSYIFILNMAGSCVFWVFNFWPSWVIQRFKEHHCSRPCSLWGKLSAIRLCGGPNWILPVGSQNSIERIDPVPNQGFCLGGYWKFRGWGAPGDGSMNFSQTDFQNKCPWVISILLLVWRSAFHLSWIRGISSIYYIWYVHIRCFMIFLFGSGWFNHQADCEH